MQVEPRLDHRWPRQSHCQRKDCDGRISVSFPSVSKFQNISHPVPMEPPIAIICRCLPLSFFANGLSAVAIAAPSTSKLWPPFVLLARLSLGSSLKESTKSPQMPRLWTSDWPSYSGVGEGLEPESRGTVFISTSSPLDMMSGYRSAMLKRIERRLQRRLQRRNQG